MPKPTAVPVPRAYVVDKRKKSAPLQHPSMNPIKAPKPVAAKVDYKAYKKAKEAGIDYFAPAQTQLGTSTSAISGAPGYGCSRALPASIPAGEIAAPARRYAAFIQPLVSGLNRIVKQLLPSAAYRMFTH